MIILLDGGPLGLISNPKATEAGHECREWMRAMITSGVRICLPEIIDYELRRELLRANKAQGLARLDFLKNTIQYLPITTPIMLKAAELWADVRRRGMPTADSKALDGDVILAAQALVVNGIVATENVDHLVRLVGAKHWRDITPFQG